MTPQGSILDTARWPAGAAPVTTPLGLLLPVGNPAPALSVLPPRADAGDGRKLRPGLEVVFDELGIADGRTLSFHHHYRDGDRVVVEVMRLARERGLKGLTICPSSIFPTHSSLVPLLEDGTITSIVTDYMRGPVADWITAHPGRVTVLLQSHGGRARAISSGQLKIDVAFVGASLADRRGNLTGRAGALACGPLGYPAVDAQYAKATVGMAHDVTDAALPRVDIPARFVDLVVPFERPGDANRIRSGSTVPSETPLSRGIAERSSDIIAAAGLLTEEFALQSGAGGYSLAAVPHVGSLLAAQGMRGAFMSGGITSAHVELLRAGVFRAIRDVQCFDLEAVRSAIENPDHQMMTAAEYASPLHPNPCVDDLSVMLLGAVEVDFGFNVNVVSGTDGRILGGPGGHPDAARGADLSIVLTSLTGGGFAKIVPAVRCVSTPGVDVDVVVTEAGFAINPARADLVARLTRAGLKPVEIEDLARIAGAQAAHSPAPLAERPSVHIERRDGLILDWV